MRYPVTELGIGGILDQSIRLFRDHFKFLIVLGCIPFLPGLIMAFLSHVETPTFGPASSTEMAPQVMWASSGLSTILFILNLLVLTFTNAICTGAAAYGLTHRYLGNDVSAGESLRAVMRRFMPLLGASILYALGTVIGTLCLIIPGIYLTLTWYVLYPTLLFENLSVFQAFGRSRRLMVGHKRKAFNIVFVLGIIWLASGMFSGIIPNAYASVAVESFFMAASELFNAVVVTVMYISARCRVEQFDLELLTQMVEGKSRAEEPVL
jgi:hypothetical protein